MQWYERIRARREERGLSQAALGKSAGVSQALINRIEKGEIKSTRVLHLIAKELDLRFDDVAELVKDEAKSAYRDARSARIKARTGPVTVLGALFRRGKAGEFFLEYREIDEVARPPKLENARGIFAFYVQDQAMSPELEPGDMVYVNPNLPRYPGVTVLLYHAEPVDRLDFAADASLCCIRRVIEITPTHWICVAWMGDSEALKEELSREEWPIADRIVLKEYRS